MVAFGTEAGRLDQRVGAYESVSYSRAEMCGPPASTIGYVHPGMMHRALLRGLQPDTRYFYQYGDEVVLHPTAFSPSSLSERKCCDLADQDITHG